MARILECIPIEVPPENGAMKGIERELTRRGTRPRVQGKRLNGLFVLDPMHSQLKCLIQEMKSLTQDMFCDRPPRLPTPY